MIKEAIQNEVYARYRFRLPEIWFSECFDYVTDELNTTDVKILFNEVIDQWKSFDLKELTVGCIPKSAISEPKLTISGSFYCQVETVTNIAKPKYKFKGEVKEDNGSRMILLNLHDGAISFRAIEYKDFSNIVDFIKPDCKLVLYGDIQFHRGVAFLTNNNVDVVL